MDLNRIQEILNTSSEMILSAASFSDRLKAAYEVLDKAFPRVSLTATISGPITNLGDYVERTEIEPLLWAIKESSRTGQVYLATDAQVNKALQLVYQITRCEL